MGTFQLAPEKHFTVQIFLFLLSSINNTEIQVYSCIYTYLMCVYLSGEFELLSVYFHFSF